MSNRWIALIGFMGSGKSTIGRALATKLSRPFIDLDRHIEEIAGMSIPEIFQGRGETAFRELETRALEGVRETSALVLATGGGVITTPENRRRLAKDWVCIYLAVSPDTVIARLQKDGTPRPLLDQHDRRERVQTLMEQRMEWYQEVADFTVDVNELSVNEVVAEIVPFLNKGDSPCNT